MGAWMSCECTSKCKWTERNTHSIHQCINARMRKWLHLVCFNTCCCPRLTRERRCCTANMFWNCENANKIEIQRAFIVTPPSANLHSALLYSARANAHVHTHWKRYSYGRLYVNMRLTVSRGWQCEGPRHKVSAATRRMLDRWACTIGSFIPYTLCWLPGKLLGIYMRLLPNKPMVRTNAELPGPNT